MYLYDLEEGVCPKCKSDNHEVTSIYVINNNGRKLLEFQCKCINCGNSFEEQFKIEYWRTSLENS